MPAIAFSNNDIALVAWTFDRHLDGCLGFAIHQIDGSGKHTVLPALARFARQDKNAKLSTEQAPVQKFWWKDPFAKRGETYKYRIVPMAQRVATHPELALDGTRTGASPCIALIRRDLAL